MEPENHPKMKRKIIFKHALVGDMFSMVVSGSLDRW